MEDEDLDELVVDAKCVEASNINNEGRETQLEYLSGVRTVALCMKRNKSE